MIGLLQSGTGSGSGMRPPSWASGSPDGFAAGRADEVTASEGPASPVEAASATAVRVAGAPGEPASAAEPPLDLVAPRLTAAPPEGELRVGCAELLWMIGKMLAASAAGAGAGDGALAGLEEAGEPEVLDGLGVAFVCSPLDREEVS